MADRKLGLLWYWELLVSIIFHYMLRLVLIAGGAEDVNPVVGAHQGSSGAWACVCWRGGGEELRGVGLVHIDECI